VSRRIQVLPDGVANQIAAGEVVERPASVVKELVENALDARAGRVEVLVEGGGKRRIRVSDDGTGMRREDALLSLDRHATSKIRTAEDLSGVRTFGFRGEALPSIAAVARMSLETRDPADEVGTAIRVEGGRIVAVDDLPRRPGTTVEVRTLFHNAPARAKFLRSTGAETRAVSDVLVSLALATPAVAFVLESDGRVLLDLPAAPDLPSRVAALWGNEVADLLIPISGQAGELGLRGLIQRPDATRPGFRRAHLFLRDRPFRESALLRAADRGYRTTIPEGHRPWLLLYLQAPDGTVDVNVHPAKAEVRFRDLRTVEGLVEESVRRALQGEESAAPLDPQLASARPGGRTGPRPPEASRPPASALQTSLFVSGGIPAVGVADGSGVAADHPETSGEAGEVPGSAGDSPPSLRGEAPRLWQVLDRYIIAETRDGLLLIDQHAAHERILFERILRAFDEEGAEAQQLLFPLTLRLTPPEYDAVTSMKGLFARVGFEIEGFGGNVVVVHAVPDPHPHFQAERALREMIAELTHGSPELRSARNQVERMAMSFACRAAIKAGQPLAEREVQELFDALFATELPFHDVHGRPTTVRLTRAELERTFGR
jgi:DNA mismatch repair protein MutL